ncbi:MAG: glycosyltransferase 87 family protein [Corynebacterium sp.]|nr:glycosyltransferase 87 family protein [Corynebacterium sp.]
MSTTRRRLSALLLIILILCPLIANLYTARVPNIVQDLSVFRDASTAFLHSRPIYGPDFIVHTQSPFVYPPFAVLLFLPLAPLPAVLTQYLWIFALFIAVFLLNILFMKSQSARPTLLSVLAISTAGIFTAPVQTAIALGQVDLLLYILILLDILGFMPKRLRGIGIGLAAAIKMTPAVFGLLLLFQRDWRAVARSAITFLATVLLGFILMPESAKYFWLNSAFDSTRAVSPNYERDMSLRALLAKSMLSFGQADAIKSILFVLGFGFAAYCAYRCVKNNNLPLAYVILVLGLMVFQPVANFHHWVGTIVIFGLLFHTPYPRIIRIGLWILGCSLILSWVIPYFLSPWVPAYFVQDPLAWLLNNQLGICGLISFFLISLGSLRHRV